MRIAVTGAHRVGKTTLIDDFVAAHPGYRSVQEPYWDLAEQGVAFSDVPSVEDFLEQLEHSVTMIVGMASEESVVFDRCPLDFIAYLEVVSEAEGGEWAPSGRLLPRIEAALATLDLIAFVPIPPSAGATADVEHPKLRRAVDARLKRLVREGALDLLGDGTRLIEISGSRRQRVAELSRALFGGEAGR
jgi:hypothetical protein